MNQQRHADLIREAGAQRRKRSLLAWLRTSHAKPAAAPVVPGQLAAPDVAAPLTVMATVPLQRPPHAAVELAEGASPV